MQSSELHLRAPTRDYCTELLRKFEKELDMVMVPFRNMVYVADLDRGLREVHRILAPGARFVILEFTTPRSAVVRAMYHLYFHHLLPRIGAVVSGHRTAYAYLPRSVANFPIEEDLAGRMRNAGFSDVRWHTLTFGVAAIHSGAKA